MLPALVIKIVMAPKDIFSTIVDLSHNFYNIIMPLPCLINFASDRKGNHRTSLQ